MPNSQIFVSMDKFILQSEFESFQLQTSSWKWEKTVKWISLQFTAIEDNNQKHVTNKHEYSLEDAIDATSEWYWNVQLHDISSKLKLIVKWHFNCCAEIGKYQKLLILTTGLSIMGAGIENVSFSYIVPFAKCDLNLTMAEQGALTSVSFLGIVSTSYFWGFLADTWGRQKVLSLSALCGFTFSFMSAFSTNTTILIVLRFLAGSLWVNVETELWIKEMCGKKY